MDKGSLWVVWEGSERAAKERLRVSFDVISHIATVISLPTGRGFGDQKRPRW
jgi:hypothetical protein